MGSHCFVLELSEPWREDRQILVQATEAARLCQEGELRTLPWRETVRRIEDLRRRGMANIRTFVAQARLLGVAVDALDDAQIVAAVQERVRRGDLIAFGAGDAGADDVSPSTAEQRRLVKEIEAMVGSLLTHQGRKYRLIVDVDLGKIRNRDSYQVTPHGEAVAVLGDLAAQPGAGPKLARLLHEARDKVTADWRPPLEPDGLVLLRRIAVVQPSAPPSGPALTPSQLAQSVQPTEVIEIQLVDTAGEPVPGEAWELLLPDGSKRSGVLDEQGRALVTSLPPGQCHVMFPALDPDAWTACGSHGL
jgi:hypothetical protein